MHRVLARCLKGPVPRPWRGLTGPNFRLLRAGSNRLATQHPTPRSPALSSFPTFPSPSLHLPEQRRKDDWEVACVELKGLRGTEEPPHSALQGWQRRAQDVEFKLYQLYSSMLALPDPTPFLGLLSTLAARVQGECRLAPRWRARVRVANALRARTGFGRCAPGAAGAMAQPSILQTSKAQRLSYAFG